MNLQRSQKKSSIVGLDIGSSSVKVVEIQEGGGKCSLLRAKRVVVDQADPDGLIRALRKASWGVPLEEGRIASVVTDPRDVFHKLTLPEMPKSELRETIVWQLKDQLPFAIGEAEWDYEVLRSFVEKDVKKVEIGVIVSPKESIRKHLALLQKVAAAPSRLIPAPLAIASLLKKGKKSFREPAAVLDIGRSGGELSIFQNGALQFLRPLPVSADDFTKALLVPIRVGDEMMTLTDKEAGEVRDAYGLCQEENLSLPDLPVRPSSVLPLVRPIAERLASEIERSLIFYQENVQGGKVSQLFLFGEGAALKGLSVFLSDSLGIEVAAGASFEPVAIKGAVEKVIQEAPFEFAASIGAALSGGEEGINLLPQEIKEKTKRLIRRATLKGVAASLILSLLFLYIGMRIELSNRVKKIAVARLELSALAPALEEAKERALRGELLKREPYWEDLFKELSQIFPEQSYLENLTVERGRVLLRGTIVSGKEDAEAVLSLLLAALEKGMFRNASLLETEKLAEREGSSFQIEAELK